MTYVAGKIVTDSFEPVQAAGLRGVGVSLILILFFRKHLVHPRQAMPFFLLGLLGVIGNQGLFFLGASHTTPAHSSLIYGFGPVLVLLIGFAARQESITIMKVVGILLSITGIIWVLGISDTINPEHVHGDLLLLAGSLCWSSYTVAGKSVMKQYGAVKTTMNSLLWGGTLFFIIGIPSIVKLEFNAIPFKTWMWLLYMMVFTSIVSYLIWYTVIHRMDSSRAAVFMNMQFPVTVLLSRIITGEKTGNDLLIGGVLVISGVIIAQLRKGKGKQGIIPSGGIPKP